MTARSEVPMAARIALSPAEAAGAVGLSVDAIRAALASGDLPARRHGRRILVLVEDITVWLRKLPSAAGLADGED